MQSSTPVGSRVAAVVGIQGSVEAVLRTLEASEEQTALSRHMAQVVEKAWGELVVVVQTMQLAVEVSLLAVPVELRWAAKQVERSELAQLVVLPLRVLPGCCSRPLVEVGSVRSVLAAAAAARESWPASGLTAEKVRMNHSVELEALCQEGNRSRTSGAVDIQLGCELVWLG